MSEAEKRPTLHLDEDVPHAAAKISRELGLDVVSALEAGLTGRSDLEQLTAAAYASRVLVTYNRDDFVELTRDFFALGKPHAGVLILTYRLPRDPARVAHALARWCANRGAMQPYEISFLSD